VDFTKVVIREIERNRSLKVFNLFTEGQGSSLPNCNVQESFWSSRHVSFVSVKAK
jgi:hypothetical protein